MADKEVNITYETLFEILRREKSRDDLQELQKSFFNDVVEYLKDKAKVMESAKGQLFSDEEIEKTRVQLANIKKIIKDLYERREKKIISMALNKSRTKSNLINTSILLDEEKEIYDAIMVVLDMFREDVLSNVINEKMPCMKKVAVSAEVAKKTSADAGQGQANAQDGASIPQNHPKKTKTIRFLKPVPKFVGLDLQVYGPFDEEDIASLPEESARVLIDKGRAEEMVSDSGIIVDN